MKRQTKIIVIITLFCIVGSITISKHYDYILIKFYQWNLQRYYGTDSKFTSWQELNSYMIYSRLILQENLKRHYFSNHYDRDEKNYYFSNIEFTIGPFYYSADALNYLKQYSKPSQSVSSEIFNELKEQFIKVNSNPEPLQKDKFIFSKYAFIVDTKSFFSERKGNEETFYFKHPYSKGISSVSNVAFSKNEKYAMVFFHHYVCGLSSDAALYIMKKENGSWIVIEEVFGEVS